jgi:hypothetical protein
VRTDDLAADRNDILHLRRDGLDGAGDEGELARRRVASFSLL